MSIPFQATHTADDGRYYMVDECEWFYANHMGHWKRHWSGAPAGLKAINQQKKQWSGPEDGLPKIGSVVELWKGSDKGTHVEIIAHFNASADLVAVYVPVEGYRHVNQAISSCFKPIITPEQLAAEKRETAIAEMAKVLPRAKHECWTCNPDGSVKPYENTYEILGLLVDAGFKREGV